MVDNRKCPEGHDVPVEYEFCQDCGRRVLAEPVAGDEAPAAATADDGENEIRRNADEVTCPQGHAVEAEDEFCRKCGTSIPPSAPGEPLEATTSDTPVVTERQARLSNGTDPTWIHLWGDFRVSVLTVGALLIGLGLLAGVILQGDTEAPSSDEEAVVIEEEAPVRWQVCTDKVIEGVDFALDGGDMNELYLEYGTQDPELRLMIQAYSMVRSAAYEQGREAAAREGVEWIELECKKLHGYR